MAVPVYLIKLARQVVNSNTRGHQSEHVQSLATALATTSIVACTQRDSCTSLACGTIPDSTRLRRPELVGLLLFFYVPGRLYRRIDGFTMYRTQMCALQPELHINWG